MKKIFSVIPLVFILSGSAETMALLGPTSSAFGGGNVLQSSLTSAASFGIKKSTGKAPIQHAIEFAEKHNPSREKEKCINQSDLNNFILLDNIDDVLQTIDNFHRKSKFSPNF